MNEIRTTLVCPYLGLLDDRSLYCEFTASAHRCYRGPLPKPVAWDRQEAFCLGENHTGCTIYSASMPTGGQAIGSKEQHQRQGGRLDKITGRRMLGATGLLLIALLVVGLVRTTLDAVTPSGVKAVTPASAATASEKPATSALAPLPAASITQVVPPKAAVQTPATTSVASVGWENLGSSDGPSPTSSPRGVSQAATATPKPTRSHVVREGENLWTISERYGTSIDTIMRLNGLSDRNYVWAGQRLLVP